MVGRLFRRLWYLLNRRRLDRELELEMAAHRAEMGDPRRFGGSLRLREQAADVWGWRWLDDLWHDLRYGLRQLRRTPGFALVAILTLAIGIGANTTAFGILNAQLFSELPVPDARALRQLEWGGRRDFREASFRYSAEHASGFSSLTCATTPAPVTLEGNDGYEQANAIEVAGDFFRTFGPAMAAGRPLTPADDRPGALPVAVISYELWQRRFGADASLLDTSVIVNDQPVTIVGVLRRGFAMSAGRRAPDLIVPMATSAMRGATEGSIHDRSCRITGRVSPGAPEAQTRRQLEAALRQSGLPLPIDRELPRLRDRIPLVLRPVARGIDERPEIVGRDLADNAPQVAGGLFLLLAVLIVPCANVGALLLARAITRRQEIAARLALGASRARLVRQLLTEGALLALLAGAAGVFMSGIVLPQLMSQASVGGSPFALDLPVLVMAGALCALATLSFALVPALTATRGDVASRVRESSSGMPGQPRRAPGTLLVAVQVVISCVVLAVAGLQIRTFLTLVPSMPAAPDHLLLVRATPDRQNASQGYIDDALNRLTRVPGVVSAAAGSSDGLYTTLCQTGDDGTSRPVSLWIRAISAGYFTTMQIPLRAGRDLEPRDIPRGNLAVIDEALARSLFGQRNPIGMRLPLAPCQADQSIERLLAEPQTIVGVASRSILASGSSPAVYLPYRRVPQLETASVTFGTRSNGGAAALAAPVREALRQTAATARIGSMQTQTEQVRQTLTGWWRISTIYILLGLLVTMQAAFGLYGTVSHFVNRRTTEIGVRMVLGARVADVVRLMVRQALTPVVIGLLLGLACSPIVARVMYAARVIGDAGWTTQVEIAGVVSIVMIAAFAAASAPVWRVSRIDPAVALREE